MRGHKFDESVKYAKGELYPFEYAANLQFVDEPVRTEEIKEKLGEVHAGGKKK